MLTHRLLIAILLLASSYVHAGGYYIDFKFEGKDADEFILTPINMKQMASMPEDVKTCRQVRVSLDYSYTNYFKSLIGAADYPSIFTHNESVSTLESTPLYSNVRFSFIGSKPFKSKGCNLQSSSLLVMSPNVYLPIMASIP